MLRVKVSKETFLKDCRRCAEFIHDQPTNEEFLYTQKCVAIKLWHHFAPLVFTEWDIPLLDPVLSDSDLKDANSFVVPIPLSPYYGNNIYAKISFTRELMMTSIFIKEREDESINVRTLCRKVREVALKWGDEARDVLEAFHLTTSGDVAEFVKNSGMFTFENSDLEHDDVLIL